MKPARIVLLLALVAAIVLLVAGPGTRLGWWDFRTGFSLLRWAAILGLVTAALSLALLAWPRMRRTGPWAFAVAAAAGIAVAAVPLNGMRQARSVPPIHDITTDTAQPPAFVALQDARRDAPNGVDYAGEDIARQQRAAYPDIGPLRLQAAPAVAFPQALAAADAMGWQLADSDIGSGRIEATATTRWFGFKDDVVIRITPDGAGSRVDVRSMSRLGGSDVGANAQRIGEYLQRLDALAD